MTNAISMFHVETTQGDHRCLAVYAQERDGYLTLYSGPDGVDPEAIFAPGAWKSCVRYPAPEPATDHLGQGAFKHG